MKPAPVTAVIKTKNEARQIEACIASIRNFVSEIIVVDDHSEDNTAQIVTRCKARVITAKSKGGMIDQLDKLGFKAATQPWILRIDADERLTPTLEAALREALASGQWNGVRFARKNMMFGEWARYGGWFKNDQLRFFRADAWDRNWAATELHTSVPVNGPILTLPLHEDLATIHNDYDSVSEFVRRTLWRYGITDAEVAFHEGKNFSGSRLLFKPMKRFLGKLILRQGFRDGWRGVILAGMLAAYDLCIEANLWDLHRRNEK